MSTMDDTPACGQCGFTMNGYYGLRHFGTYSAHMESDCMALMRTALAARDSVIANLEAKFAQAMAALERVADPMTSWRDCGLIARQALAARGAWDERSGE